MFSFVRSLNAAKFLWDTHKHISETHMNGDGWLSEVDK